jgi:hypothetical protein
MQGTYWISGRGIRRPLRADMSAGAGEFIATEPQTGIFGVGTVPSEAIEDLRTALVDHRRVLETAQTLSPDLARCLFTLRHHFGSTP